MTDPKLFDVEDIHDFPCLALLCCLFGNAQSESMVQRLGYPAGTRPLILHADDLGVAHSENAASITAFEKGPLNSASIIAPCPWFPEIAEYARKYKSMDFGLQVTLTSEWKNYKWGPVSSKDLVSILENDTEMQAMTIDHPDYGSQWRQAEHDFLMSDECAAILKSQNIKMVTWRELRDKVTRAK